MGKLLTKWDNLDSIPKGKGMHPHRDYIHNAIKGMHYYASVAGLVLSTITFIMAVI